MKLSAYVNRIPGLTVYTPVTQLGVQQSPNLAGYEQVRRRGLGTATPDPTVSTGLTGIFDTAKQYIANNPVPVMVIIAGLLLRK